MGTYINAMEILVEQEVEQQVKSLPPKVASYINRLELVAFALNQLPALYATNERGLAHQLQRGKVKYAVSIRQAVQRAIIAIQRDPIRSVVPLQAKQPPIMQEVLNRMRLLLKNEKISWDTLPTAVEQAIASTPRPLRGSSTASEPTERAEAAHRRISPAVRHYSGMPHSSPFAPLDSTPTSPPGQTPEVSVNRPDAKKRLPPPPQQSPVSSQPGQMNSPTVKSSHTTGEHEIYGWDDPFYRV